MKVIRLKNVTIKNFKNIEYGNLTCNNQNEFGGSVLGIYGQNGTGKTSFINAIQLLKYALTGSTIPQYFVDYINVDSDSADFKYELSLANNDEIYNVTYKFKLGKNQDYEDGSEIITAPKIFNEILSYSYNNENESIRKSDIINTITNDTAFFPSTKYKLLIEKNIKPLDLLVLKARAAEKSKSFIFLHEFQKIIDQTNDAYSNHSKKKDYNDFKQIYSLLKSLINYAQKELFIINTTNNGFISLNGLPITYRRASKSNKVSYGTFILDLYESESIPTFLYNETKKIIDSINIVLGKIIPDLEILVQSSGSEITAEGIEKTKIQFFSIRNGKKISLVYESEGIKKIISILQLLIVMYNQPNITVAIDELDSGIFEYLLGELLLSISESGEGQLIFTSHNLRPLEMIDKKFVAFTTSNAKNRIIRLNGIKENNNLRDFYFRAILLGGQHEKLYESSKTEIIEQAFTKAGDNMDE